MVNIGIRHFRPAFGIVQPRISWVLIGTGVESQNTQFRLVSCQCGGRQFGHITVRHANCRSVNLTTQYILITPKTTESLHTTQPDFSFVLPFRASPGCGRQGRARGCDVTPTSRMLVCRDWHNIMTVLGRYPVFLLWASVACNFNISAVYQHLTANVRLRTDTPLGN